MLEENSGRRKTRKGKTSFLWEHRRVCFVMWENGRVKEGFGTAEGSESCQAGGTAESDGSKDDLYIPCWNLFL